LIAAFAAMVPKGNDLCHVIAAIFLRHVFDQFAAPPHAKIYVDIRHRNAFRIQKPFKQQVVLQRIYVGNPQRVAHQTARG
jgi:hypothetical protein